MFCSQCGQRLADGSRFCNQCGTPTAAGNPPPAPEPARATPPPPPAPAATPTPPAAAAPAAGRGAGSGSGAGGGGSAGPAPAFDSAKAAADATQLARGIFARVKNILLTPSTEWPVIAAERSTPGAIYLRYVAPLVAIGVIATFIGQTVIGTSLGPLGVARVGIAAGLAHAIVLFGLSFLQVFLVSWLVDALAPSFSGQRNSLAALKLTAYSLTPAWVAAVLNVIPMLGVFGILAGLYGLYLLYLGLPVLMRNPQEKSIGYTIVLVICAIVLSVLVTVLSTCATGGLAFIGLGPMAPHAGSAESAAATTNALGQIMARGKDVQPIDFRELKAMLPASLPGMQRNEASGQSGEALGMKGSNATGRYGDGANASIRIEITDLGSLSGLAALAGKFDVNVEKETSTSYERTRRIDGQLVHERYDRRAKSGEVSVIVANRFSVTVEGSGVEPATLANALKAIDLSSLAAMTMAQK